ncbi:carboxypeptidase B-like [Aricia agestis]|uniref:carboxypeptidase B-like n=1 Tax=Aricia agestis TaxID=91739 RepID=UPI001C206607|nr:carboxypeptidase B-like [Aricia agestis]
MAKWIFVLCVLRLSEIVCGEISQNYDNHTLVRLYPENMKQLEVIEHMVLGLEVLKYTRGLNDSTDVLVPGDQMRSIQEMVEKAHLKYDAKEHYGRLFDNVNRVAKRRSGGFSVYEYHSYNAIRDHIEFLAKKYPDLITLQTLGNSFQGRRMKLVKISSNPNASNPIIFVDAGIHGREWVAPAMALYLIERLVSDPSARSELAGLDWYILPVVNPDGYEYSRTSKANRLWRKTRSKPSGYDCFGVDGNRNYDYKWAVSGVSKNPCDGETYAGPKPFSEIETQMVRNVMLENQKRLKLYVSLHSYGNYLVYPWGYTGEILPKEWRRLDTLAKNVARAIYGAGGDHLTVMSAGKWYPAAGGSDDYAFGVVGVPYSYTMELTKGYEFIFPERLLKEVLPQYYIGFRVFANQIKKEFSNRREKSCLDDDSSCQ